MKGKEDVKLRKFLGVHLAGKEMLCDCSAESGKLQEIKEEIDRIKDDLRLFKVFNKEKNNKEKEIREIILSYLTNNFIMSNSPYLMSDDYFKNLVAYKIYKALKKGGYLK